MRALRCRHVAELPALQPAEQIVAVTVTFDDRLAVLAVSGAANLEEQRTARVLIHDGDSTWWPIPVTGCPAVAYPLLDLRPDGRILVVGSRSRRFRDGTVEDNAHVLGPSGGHVRSFCLGDGIEHVGVDAAGTIWVAYFDEGVFGNNGWTDPVGAAGLVRFDDHGHPVWRYQPPAGVHGIVDCYAMNVDARITWAYYYSDFPLVRITAGRARAFVPTPVRGAHHLITYRDEVVFVGGYEDRLRLTECRLTGTTVDHLGPAVLHDPAGDPLHLYRPVTTRGSRLWLQVGDRILLADLADDR